VVTPLLAAMARNAENGSLLRHSAWLLSNLARPRPQSNTLLEAVPTLSAILVTPDQVGYTRLVRAAGSEL
jgi:hypothetical protein